MSTGNAPWTIPAVEKTEDPTWYRMLDLCDEECHHPVHAFGHPERMRHLIEADLAEVAIKNGWIEPRAALVAIRSKRTSGRAHLAASWTSSFGRATVCGRALSNPEEVAWDQTAPEDRCVSCTKAADDERS